MSAPALLVRALRPVDAQAYYLTRLGLLRSDPLAYATAEAEFAGTPLPELAAELAGGLGPQAGCVTYGLYSGSDLLGLLRVERGARASRAHCARLSGLGVLPSARGQGGGGLLLQAAIRQARAWPGVTRLSAAVPETQTAALALAARWGFGWWGSEPQARVDRTGRGYALHHLALEL